MTVVMHNRKKLAKSINGKQKNHKLSLNARKTIQPYY